MSGKTTLPVKGINIFVPLRVDALPRDIVPAEGPADDFEWEVVLEGGALRMLARLNGSNYRRMLKTIDDHQRNVGIVLRGKLRATADGGPLVLESAGFDVKIKRTRPGSSFPPAGRSSTTPYASVSKPASVGASAVNSEPSNLAPASLPGTALPGRRVFVPVKNPARRG